MLIGYLLRGISLGLYAGILPGPTQAYIVSKTIKNGWKQSLPLALVPLVSDLPIAILFCLLVSTFPVELISHIQTIGGGYLIFLGVRTWTTAKASGEATGDSPNTGFWQTVGVNLGNPNVYIFWGTIGAPIVLSGMAISSFVGVSFIFGMYAALVATTAATILLFGTAGKLPQTAKEWMIRILSAAVTVFGILQVVTGANNIIRH